MGKDFQSKPLVPELYCSDISITLNFYVAFLGFEICYQRPEHGFAMLERQGTQIMIQEFNPDKDRVWLLAPLDKPYGRGISFQIKTTDVVGLYNKIAKQPECIFLVLEDKWYRSDDYELGRVVN